MMRVFTLTPDELLGVWRRQRLYEPAVCAPGAPEVTRTDAPGIDELLGGQIHSAYAWAVENVDADALPLTDISALLTLKVNRAGVGEAMLPGGVTRVVSVMTDAWDAPAKITDSSDTLTVARQANYYSRGGRAAPVAIVLPDRMLLYSFEKGATPAITSCMAMRMPGPGENYPLTYTLLSKMLSYELS